MLQIDEAIAQTPLKDLAQVELVMTKIPTKALYKLRVSVAQEVQSCTRTDLAKLHHTKNGKGALEMVLERVNLKTKEENGHTNIMEQDLTTMYNRIPNSAQAVEISTEDNINLNA